jgi:hypothetical protein
VGLLEVVNILINQSSRIPRKGGLKKLTSTLTLFTSSSAVSSVSSSPWVYRMLFASVSTITSCTKSFDTLSTLASVWFTAKITTLHGVDKILAL